LSLPPRGRVVLAFLTLAAAACSTTRPSPAHLPLPYTTPAEFHEAIVALYDFRPLFLTDEERAEKARALDAFWNRCGLDPETCLPRLRTELRVPSNPPLFLFDGSRLLLKLSPRAPDRHLALRTIAGCDLRDLPSADYLATVHRLAVEGFDTTDAAFHILDEPSFVVELPQYGLRLGQDYALILMLVPTDERFYVSRALVRLDTERDETALASLLLLVWYTGTEAGDAAIARVAERGRSSRVRAYAESMEDRTRTLRTDPRVADFVRLNSPRSEPPSLAQLRELRRAALGQISDEALRDFDALTVLLRRANLP
jgi:hypothetical protein